MSMAQLIRDTLQLPVMVVHSFLDDLTDAELLVRPHPQMNHIAWQMGHLICSEHEHVQQVVEKSLPPLPDGFAERHTRKRVANDSPEDFLRKEEYLDAMERQRQVTLDALMELSDEELSQPSPESIRYFGPTVGSVFTGESTHWMMHAGQWAVIRRALGKPPVF